MMITTTDTADSGDIPRHIPGESGVRRLIRGATTNLAAQRLRARGQIYSAARLSAADTISVRIDLTADPDDVAAAKLRVDEPFIGVPYVAGDLFGLPLQDPPTGNPPPLPPQPAPTKAEERPDGYISRHRRHLMPLLRGVLIGGGVVAAVYTGLIVAALIVLAVAR